jgi:Family of unknown function (DUF5681)
MRDDGENGRLGSPTFLPWPAARPAVFRLRPCVRLLGLYLRALGSLPLVSLALVSGSSVLRRPLKKQFESNAFQPGQSGNPAGKPKGTRNKTTLAVEALPDGEAETLTRKAIELANLRRYTLGTETCGIRAVKI